ncbi:MAG: aminopeptidase [Bacillota bacterium]|nr:aminopeptidase [Bacillota bacterium]
MELEYKPKYVFEAVDDKEADEIYRFCEQYKTFLNYSVTERRCIKKGVEMAKERGFKPFDEMKTLKSGDKVYAINRAKNLILAVIGKQPIENGVNILGSHIDSPRLDLKPMPLYDDSKIAYLKTHYYGGIKKYQWTTIPMALYGKVVTKSGEVDIEIDGEDYAFVISDLLPHLASEQMKKTMTEGVSGEQLNLIAGSRTNNEEESIKENILKLLNEKYGIVEEDFISSEFEAVPAMKTRDIGFDRSMVGGYGQDDRVCAYACMQAIFDCDPEPEMTAICVWADKEEIGSMGNTGMQSKYTENTIAEMIELQSGSYNDLKLRRCISNSYCISSDVAAAFDPSFASVFEKGNAAFLGRGVVIEKYVGARGKSGSNDSSAELIGKMRHVLNENEIVWQFGELGKVDGGGGGTISQYVANLNCNVIDSGVALLSMHAPFEVASKGDIYMAYKGYKAFLNKFVK